MRPQVGIGAPQRPPPTLELEIEFTGAVLAYFRKEAQRRDLPVKRFVNTLLDVIATDQLAAAILDD
jgi:hypothetical protein